MLVCVGLCRIPKVLTLFYDILVSSRTDQFGPALTVRKPDEGDMPTTRLHWSLTAETGQCLTGHSLLRLVTA